MAKIDNDKYYTPKDLARHCINKVFEVVGVQNITNCIEPSAGNGAFSSQIPISCVSYDIEPEHKSIYKQDFLELEQEYEKGLLVIGNPPYGRCLSLAQKFYKKSTQLGDYIAFILPISQLNNTNSMYEFDLIYSEDLGKRDYSDRKLHCCFNIYKRPKNGQLNQKRQNKLKSVEIVRQDSKKYNEIENYDIRMCYWGNGTAGKILIDENEKYSGEYKIIVKNNELKDEIIKTIKEHKWKEEIKGIAMKKIQQHHIVSLLKEKIPEIK